jgi:ribosomal protein L18E
MVGLIAGMLKGVSAQRRAETWKAVNKIRLENRRRGRKEENLL